jgi:DNA-directed RNA polymerase subunit K/omega
MPPKAKKEKKISKKVESEISDTESEQSNLSDGEFPQKEDIQNKNVEETNIIHGGNDEDDNLVDYDEAQGDEEADDKEEDKDDDDDNDEKEEDDDDGKESISKNDEIKGDDDDDDDDDCVYRVTKKGIIYDDDDDDDEDNFFEDDIDIKNVYVTEEDRITTRKLTKYERVNIIGTRAKQIELGAQRMVKDTKGMPPKQIAKLELEMKVCPIIIKRKLPSGAIELIDVNTLNIVN